MKPTSPRVSGHRDEDGAVVVEFAVVFILFVTLVWGLITYGVIFAVQQSLTHAASEATRAVINMADVDGDGDPENDAQARAIEIVNDQLAWTGAGPPVLDINPVMSDCGAASRCLTVTVTYDWQADPIVPSILDIVTPRTLSATAVVEFS